MNREMQKALEADGEKLRALTGKDHGPVFLSEPVKHHGMFCPKCGERENLAPQTEFVKGSAWHERGGQRLTGKTECRNCNHVF